MRRRALLGSSAGLAAAGAGVVAAPAVLRAQATFSWRMANLYPRGVSYAVCYQAFADNVAKMSDGRLTIENVYDGEGVPATEVLSATRIGLVEMGAPYMALHAGELPAGLVELGLPGGPTRFDQIFALFYDGGWIPVLREAYADQGLHYLAPYLQPGVYLLTKKRIESLADLDGLKLRSPGAYGRFIKTFGVAPVTMAFSELYTSLATGVVDGAASSNLIDYRDGSFIEQAKYIYPVPVSGAQVSPIIINMNAWNSLPDDLKAVLEAAAVEHGLDQANKSIVWVAEAVEDMKGQGMEWGPEPSPEDRQRWQEAASAVWADYEADPFAKRLVDLQREFMAKLG